jgi:hypothetical protein
MNDKERKMNAQKLSQLVMWGFLITLLLAACGAPAAAPTSEIVVTFDGVDCTVSGPTELPVGEHPFVLKDLSERKVKLYVTRLTDGHTFQDWLDMQSEPGEYFDRPYWVVGIRKIGTEWNESKGGEVFTYYLDKEGDYSISIGTIWDSLGSWFCAPLKVVEAPSE